MKHPRKQEGAALFVVLMIVMVGTASAVFSANAVSHEVRGAGFARQHLQTRYTGRAAVAGGVEWLDIFGAETLRNLMQTPGSTEGVQYSCGSTSCYPEPPLANNRRAYRLYKEHFEALLSQDGGVTPGLLTNVPFDQTASFGANSAHTPVAVVDIYDERIINKLTPGAAAQGGTKFKYMRSTLTARASARVSSGDIANEPEDQARERNEAGGTLRACVINGPLITGS